MNHRLISLWLPFVFAIACGGGGGGEALDLPGSPTAGDPIPPNSDDPAPNNDDPPPPPDGTTSGGDPGDGGGDACAMACAKVTANGCDTSQGECVSGCQSLAGEECGAQVQALLFCAANVYCPEDLENLGAEIVTLCPTQAADYAACLSAGD